MKELQMAWTTLLIIMAFMGGLMRFLDMLFEIARFIAKRIDRKEVVLTAKEIEEIVSYDDSFKEVVLRRLLNKRNIPWRSMSFNKINSRLYYWTNYNI